jgi:hypothetical protein
VELELDSDVVIRSLQGGALGSVQERVSVRKIRRLAGGWLRADWSVGTNHIYREQTYDCGWSCLFRVRVWRRFGDF